MRPGKLQKWNASTWYFSSLRSIQTFRRLTGGLLGMLKLQVASSMNVGCCAVPLGSSSACGFDCSIYTAAPSTSPQSSVELSSSCLEQCCKLFEIPLPCESSPVTITLVFNTNSLGDIKELKFQMTLMCFDWLILTDIPMRNKGACECCVCVSVLSLSPNTHWRQTV